MPDGSDVRACRRLLRLGAKHCLHHFSASELFERRSIALKSPAYTFSDECVFVFFDVETTGLDPVFDRIIDLCALCTHTNAIFSTLVNPAKAILNSDIHGIDDTMVSDCLTFDLMWPSFVSWLQSLSDNSVCDVCLVAHNAKFDWQFLAFELSRYSINHNALLDNESFNLYCIDSLEIARYYLPDLQPTEDIPTPYSLASLSELLGVSTQQTHRAEGDVLLLVELMSRLEEEFEFSLHDIRHEFAQHLNSDPAIHVMSHLTQEAFKQLPSQEAVEWIGGVEILMDIMGGWQEVIHEYIQSGGFIDLLQKGLSKDELAEQCFEYKIEQYKSSQGTEFLQNVIEAIQEKLGMTSWEDWLDHIEWTLEDCFGEERFLELLMTANVDWQDEVEHHLGRDHFLGYYANHSKHDEVTDDEEWCIESLKDELGAKHLMHLAGIDVEDAREAVWEDHDLLEKMIENLGGWSEIADAFYDDANGMLEAFECDWLSIWIDEDLESLVEQLGGFSTVIHDIIGLEEFLDSVNGLEGFVERFDGEEEAWMEFVLEHGGVESLLLLFEEHVAPREEVDDAMRTDW
jgi:DNA polymerase III epsilon subunit-like protein